MTDAVSVRQPSLGVTRGRWGRHVRSAARTLATVAVTILGLMALTFFIGRLLPLDPVLAILGDNASQEAYAKLYTQLGLDRPLPVQFASSRARVIWRHAFPNIAVQLVTVVALSYAFLLEGAVLT
jgi:ABC-type dipeptide/oligopeptide/nickel transport system permease component